MANTGQSCPIQIFFLVLADFDPANIGVPDSLKISDMHQRQNRDALSLLSKWKGSKRK